MKDAGCRPGELTEVEASEEPLSQSIAGAKTDFVPTGLICCPHTKKARLRDFEAEMQEMQAQQERGCRRRLY